MTAFELIEELEGRGFALALDDAGRLLVNPVHRLTPEDRDALKHHLPSIKRLLSSDYSDMADGWQLCPALPSRAMLIHQGRLLDSVCFTCEGEARDFMRRIRDGEPAETAWKAATAEPQKRAA